MSTLALGRPGRAAKAKKTGRAKKKRSRAAAPSTEYNLLLTATLCLLALGAVMVFSASSTTQILSNGNLSDSAFYLKRTLIFGAFGLLVMHLTARHGLVAVRRLTPALLVGSLFLLFVVLVAGSSANGASRWIGPGSLQFQPSELAKVALILYGADLLAREPKRVRTIQGLMPFLLVVATACLLIVAEPDMGTAMVIAFSVGGNADRRRRPPRATSARSPSASASSPCLMTVVEPYRMARLTGFLHPGSDAAGAGFQAAQAKIALGSGGIFGVGIGNGVQKAFYLPEAHTDMISAVIGEELGMIGIVGVVGLFSLVGYAGLRVAQQAKDRYAKLLVAGPHLADPGPGDDQPLRRDGTGAADRRAAAIRLLRQQQPARNPLRRRPDPQRRPRGDRRRWQTARRRGRAIADPKKEQTEPWKKRPES